MKVIRFFVKVLLLLVCIIILLCLIAKYIDPEGWEEAGQRVAVKQEQREQRQAEQARIKKAEREQQAQIEKAKQEQRQALIPQSGTVERLEYEVKRALGSSNRGVAKVPYLEVVGITIKIGFTVDDNLFEGWIKSGAKTDIMKILKAIQSSRYNYSEVLIFGSFPLMDKYGNSSEDIVLRVSYTRNIINRINWENELMIDAYKIADSVWLQTTFR